METNPFILTLPTGPARRLAGQWLLLALCSLVGSGLVVILIVLARTPAIHDLIPWTGSFKTALVIHVDLSVLVWFLSFTSVLGAFALRHHRAHVGRAALGMAAAGAVIITLSPFLGADAPYMNNYVPVLKNVAFFLGLFLFCLGFGVMALFSLLNRRPRDGGGERALRFGVDTALLVAILAGGSLVWTYFSMPAELAAAREKHYFEVLFWGGGHILQFTHTQLLMVVWLWLAALSGAPAAMTPRVAMALFALGAAPALVGPVIDLTHEIGGIEHRTAYTTLMEYGGALGVLPLSLLLLGSLLKPAQADPDTRPLRLALLLSLFLFAVGGAIGFMIRGVNVTIPAHYHGSIVAITLAYMGLTYHLLAGLGYRRPSPVWSSRQLFLYGVGSFLHIGGLAWSGGHGVQRKTAGAAQGLETLADKIPMWIMGAGGILAVIGGVLFLVLAFRAFGQGKVPKPEAAA